MPRIRLPRPLWIALATIVLVVVGIGVRVGVPIYRQQKVLRECERLGAEVIYAHRGPDWVSRSIYRRLPFDRVTCVYYYQTAITDAELTTNLRALPELQYLMLDGAQISDAGLTGVESLSDLKVVRLCGTNVGDGALVRLTKLSGLRELYLDHTAVTDAGLEHLRAMSGLKVLALVGTQVTNEGATMLNDALPQCKIVTAGPPMK